MRARFFPTRSRPPAASSARRSMADPRERRAVFLDRDGTIIEDPGFLHEPEKVRLLEGAADAIRDLNRAGWLVVTVSNQSGIARGQRLGGRCFLVATGEGALHERQALALAVPVLPTLADAVREILE